MVRNGGPGLQHSPLDAGSASQSQFSFRGILTPPPELVSDLRI